jgi:hypothetical protein
VSAVRWLGRAWAALAGFARGFVGLPTRAHTAACARAGLAEAAGRRGRCC